LAPPFFAPPFFAPVFFAAMLFSWDGEQVLALRETLYDGAQDTIHSVARNRESRRFHSERARFFPLRTRCASRASCAARIALASSRSRASRGEIRLARRRGRRGEARHPAAGASAGARGPPFSPEAARTTPSESGARRMPPPGKARATPDVLRGATRSGGARRPPGRRRG
jgi:hypothetical protein